MKSKTFKDFFSNFKDQSTCLICGKALYIKKMDIDYAHLIKGCSNHQYHYISRSVNINKDLFVFNRDGLLVSLAGNLITPIDIFDVTTIYNEQSFVHFMQNWKIIS